MVTETRTSSDGAFGIRATLPPDDPMRSPHLLGEDFGWTRWYPTASERDRAYAELNRPLPYYRLGDHPRLELRKVER